ncbi:MAG: radical SAM protein [Candidatus Hydrogenedentes bacterium]|nr:radical SAM protein [Candidatus Hydrogenedentota bacterium]
MNIRLITPRMSLRPMDSEYKRRMAPPINLLTLAALTPEEHTVEIWDENARPYTHGARKGEVDLVGISVNVDTAHDAYRIARTYREQGLPVVLGGIHASACPEEAEQHCDGVCVGEAESVWEQMLHDVSNGGLKKRYYGNSPVDPARIPPPRRSLASASDYLYTNIVCASRGCPYQCVFCYNSCHYVHHLYRPRPVAQVIAEIEALEVRHVMFIDDNLFGQPRWTRELIAALKPLGVTWHAAVSANIAGFTDVLDSMAESGCRSLFIGFESINPEAIRSARKRQNHIASYNRLIQMLHERGIMVNASMVFGFDSDGPEIFPATLGWLVQNKVETLTSHILTPYPGTALFEQMQAEGRIIDTDLRHYNTAHVVYRPKGMSAQELHDGYLWMYRQFYALPNILRRLPDRQEMRMPYLLFNLGYRKFGKFTSRVASMGMMRSVGAFGRRLSYGIG